jgi:hypothetical protein
MLNATEINQNKFCIAFHFTRIGLSEIAKTGVLTMSRVLRNLLSFTSLMVVFPVLLTASVHAQEFELSKPTAGKPSDSSKVKISVSESDESFANQNQIQHEPIAEQQSSAMSVSQLDGSLNRSNTDVYIEANCFSNFSSSDIYFSNFYAVSQEEVFDETSGQFMNSYVYLPEIASTQFNDEGLTIRDASAYNCQP